MPDAIMISTKAFRKNADGSWTALQVTEIQKKVEVAMGSGTALKTGAIRLDPGMTFRKGYKVWDVDVAELLDQNSAAA
jgi:hypothetical protein